MDTEPFEVPQEIKEKVATKLRNSGALKQISRKIKVGMTAAIHELRNLKVVLNFRLSVLKVLKNVLGYNQYINILKRKD